jgi:hypothetical protein
MTQTIVDMDAYAGRILPINFYGFREGSADQVRFLALQKEIEEKMSRGDPVYVSFRNDDRRRDSVGKIKSCQFNYEPFTRAVWGRSNDYIHANVENIEVVWDGRKNKVKPHAYEIYYLPDWNTGTQWFWEQTVREKPDPVIAHDHLGQELEVGMNVCFVHRKYGNVEMKFGTVTRFSDKGSVFVKVMKLKDDQRDAGLELKALSMDDVVIVNDALMKRLIMAKLAAN